MQYAKPEVLQKRDGSPPFTGQGPSFKQLPPALLNQ
jgi:hypothetical protein